jgi:SdrD B-like domain
MRFHLRLVALCTVAVLAAGCTNDSPTSNDSLTASDRAASTAQCTNTVGNRVWYDTNCNGIQDTNETTGPSGVMVTLRNCDTQVERTTTTDASGNYSFADVPTGDYIICIDIPDGYKATLEDEGSDDGLDSDINDEGCTGCRTYTCESDDLSRDAGICEDTTGECENTIGNRVWYDVNCNGIQDADETGGPEGVKVVLRNCDTGDARGTTTDANGFYSFEDVPTGEYTICIEIPEGFAATLEDEGSDDDMDSDINAEGCTGCRLYDCATDDISRDAGLCEKKEEEDFEGCTPGFWRNHLTHWAATPYSPGDEVNDVFGCDLVADDDVTLGEAIDRPQTYGTLVFHAIAALLNSTHPGVDFELDASEVIEAACDGDKSTLSEANEEGCPLSGGNTTGGGGGKKK